MTYSATVGGIEYVAHEGEDRSVRIERAGRHLAWAELFCGEVHGDLPPGVAEALTAERDRRRRETYAAACLVRAERRERRGFEEDAARLRRSAAKAMAGSERA